MESSISNLQEWISKSTYQHVSQSMHVFMQAWRTNLPLNIQLSTIPHLTTALQSQTEIGRSAFMYGFVSSQWVTLQQTLYEFQKT